MASTTSNKKQNWTEDEKLVFVQILADPDDDYAFKLK